MREPKFKVNDRVYVFALGQPIKLYIGTVREVYGPNYYEVIDYNNNKHFLVEERLLSLFDQKEKRLKIAELIGDTSI